MDDAHRHNNTVAVAMLQAAGGLHQGRKMRDRIRYIIVQTYDVGL